MALQMTRQKAEAAAELRDLLVQAYNKQSGLQHGSSTAGSTGSTVAQAAAQQQAAVQQRTTQFAQQLGVVRHEINITSGAGASGSVTAVRADAAGAGQATPATAAAAVASMDCSRGSGRRIRMFIGVYVSARASAPLTGPFLKGHMHKTLLGSRAGAAFTVAGICCGDQHSSASALPGLG